MKRARITEQGQFKKGGAFWYELVAIDEHAADRKPLQRESARPLEVNRSEVDPTARLNALAYLTTWATRNGWTVEETSTDRRDTEARRSGGR